MCYDCMLPVTDVHDQDGWSGCSYEAQGQIVTVYSLHFNMQNVLMVQWIVALRSFCHSQVDKWTISRMTRIQGNEKYLLSRGSLGCGPQQYFWWLSVQWCIAAFIYDYCHQRFPPSYTWYFHAFDYHKWERLYWYMTLTHCYYCSRCIIYYMWTCKVENLMQVWFLFGLQCDILWNYKFIKVLSVFNIYIMSNKCWVFMVPGGTLQ